MNNIRKFAYYLKKSGLRQTLALVLSFIRSKLRYLWFRTCAGLFSGKKLSAAAEKCKGRTVMVFTPSVEWSFLFQRAQQMAHSYAAQGAAVIFLTTQRSYDSFIGVKEAEENLFLVNENLAGRLDEVCRDAKKVVTCIYNIAGIPVSKLYRSDLVVYEYVDDISVTVSGADDLSSAVSVHEDILHSADLVVATASKLYEEALQKCRRVIFSPNAADYDFFSAPAEKHPRYAELQAKYSCVLGYYGALASWFDYELVSRVAEAHPDWAWLLVGKKIDNDMERSRIEKLPNVFYAPAVPYTELPSYVACCDIMTIPFVLNDITAATSPVKLFEYMAAGKPVITSDMTECRSYRSVHICSDAHSFIALAELALSRRNDPEYTELLRKEASENTWQSRARAVLEALEEN